MQDLQSAERRSSLVSALFAGSEISFTLSDGATFADLADSLDQLGKRNLGRALAINLRLGLSDRPTSALSSGI